MLDASNPSPGEPAIIAWQHFSIIINISRAPDKLNLRLLAQPFSGMGQARIENNLFVYLFIYLLIYY